LTAVSFDLTVQNVQKGGLDEKQVER